MSETDEPTFTTGEASVQEQHGYAPLAEAPKPEEAEYNSDASDGGGIRQAAKDLNDQRQQANSEPVDRSYRERAGTGELVDDNLTVKLPRAADDLAKVREIENAEIQDQAAANLAAETDRIRLLAAGIDIDALQAQAQQQANPQAQPAEQPIDPTTPGIDPEISKMLENPKLRAALEQEVQQIEQARNQYAQATEGAFKTAGAAFLVSFPELQGLSAEGMAGAIAAMQRTNPERAQAILHHAQQVNMIYQQSEHAKASAARFEQQKQQQNLRQWMEQQDAQFSAEAAKEPQRVAEVQKHGVEILTGEYGISKDELSQLINHPVTRSAAGQRILMDAISYRLAQRNAMQNPVRSLPPVMRPGVSRPPMSGNDSHVAELQAKFERTGDPRDGARLLMARRAAR